MGDFVTVVRIEETEETEARAFLTPAQEGEDFLKKYNPACRQTGAIRIKGTNVWEINPEIADLAATNAGTSIALFLSWERRSLGRKLFLWFRNRDLL